MSVSLLAHCPRIGCKARIECELGQDWTDLRSLLVKEGWHFDQDRREWRCPQHRERTAPPKLKADARKELSWSEEER